MRNDDEREELGRKELVEFQARMGCNEIGAQPEVTYPAGCGRSGTYVTNTRSVHVAYRRLSGIITKQSGLPLPKGSSLSIQARERGFRVGMSARSLSLFSPWPSRADQLTFDLRPTDYSRLALPHLPPVAE